MWNVNPAGIESTVMFASGFIVKNCDLLFQDVHVRWSGQGFVAED